MQELLVQHVLRRLGQRRLTRTRGAADETGSRTPVLLKVGAD
jgi:hypothetical protein